jgi:hypothetical protein
MVTLAAAPADEGSVWWLWVLGGLAAWMVVAVLFGVVIGRGIRQADQQAAAGRDPSVLLAPTTAERPVRVARQRRRAIPLPPIGIALFAVAVALETVGYVSRLNGASGTTARLLSMDAPFSVPRMYVAALFAAAALAAVAGAGNTQGRRTWWLAVGLVAGGVAAVKAGSTVHADGLRALESVASSRGALALSALAAAVVVAALWFLSRTERRDRRRVLGALALYAGAAVGLSAVSSLVAGAYGGASTWAAAATFLEESGEALAGVGFLIAVLVGVAPRLVLPAAWALRRAEDANTLVVPEDLAGRRTPDRPATY